MPQTPELSVVLPVYNEEASLAELVRRLRAALEGMGLSYELLFVDDHSRDGSLALLRSWVIEDGPIRVLAFSRNFGHQAALTAGLDHARGDAVIFMDSDLQDPPELIPDLYARFRQGFPVVYAKRKSRPGESLFKRLSAFVFYRLLRLSTQLDIPADTGDFRLLSRQAADAMKTLKEKRRFLRGLVAWMGFRRCEVLYDRPARSGGESNYSLTQMVRLGLTAVFSFSSLPISVIGLGGAILIAISPVAWWFSRNLTGSGVILLAGVQLASLWVLGQYILVVTDEARERPLYVLAESLPSERAEISSRLEPLAASREAR